MIKLIIHTQILENYGAHSWDGIGKCPQYWKAKGGESYEVATLGANEAADTTLVDKLVQSSKVVIDRDDDYSKESLVDWELADVGDGQWLSEHEKSQLEYEGSITFPHPVIRL